MLHDRTASPGSITDQKKNKQNGIYESHAVVPDDEQPSHQLVLSNKE
jgi:hypothetical protein